MSVQRDSAHQIITRCKEGGLKVVAGGPLFTSEYEEFDLVDHFVLNEAELTLPLFLADLERGSAKPGLQNLRIFQHLGNTGSPVGIG